MSHAGQRLPICPLNINRQGCGRKEGRDECFNLSFIAG